jgi:hypothetical protein
VNTINKEIFKRFFAKDVARPDEVKHLTIIEQMFALICEPSTTS